MTLRSRREIERIEVNGKRRSSVGITLEIYPEGERPSYPKHCPQVVFMAAGKNSLYVKESTMMSESGGQSSTTDFFELNAKWPWPKESAR
jgi:hypothetical protein